MTETRSEAGSERENMLHLLEIMRALRDPESGCPWDVEQSFATIAPYTIEEAYEVADAIERESWSELRDELGDLLLQVVFHAQMASEKGLFTFDDVAGSICDKMIRRHPHVFGDDRESKTAAQQTIDWEKAKAAERGSDTATLDGIAIGLPPLTRAVKLQKRAARVGFDWPHIDDVVAKITEEARELAVEIDRMEPPKITEEYGDLLFVMANLARHLDIDPDAALRQANAKFTRRFNAVEQALIQSGSSPQQSTLAEMDRLWDEVKRTEQQTEPDQSAKSS